MINIVKVFKEKAKLYLADHREKKINRIIISIFFVGALIAIIFRLSFDKTTLFWLYSAISQSMAALLGVLGIFIVFRYEIIEKRINDYYEVVKKNILEHSLFMERPKSLDTWTFDDIDYVVDKAVKKQFGNLGDNQIQFYVVYQKVINSWKDAKVNIVRRARLPIFSLITVIISSIILLAAVNVIACNIWGTIFSFFLMFFVFFSLVNFFFYLRNSFPR
jgi:ABC-type multidrug transport system fused ATPase/permease subunit